MPATHLNLLKITSHDVMPRPRLYTQYSVAVERLVSVRYTCVFVRVSTAIWGRVLRANSVKSQTITVSKVCVVNNTNEQLKTHSDRVREKRAVSWIQLLLF